MNLDDRLRDTFAAEKNAVDGRMRNRVVGVERRVHTAPPTGWFRRFGVLPVMALLMVVAGLGVLAALRGPAGESDTARPLDAPTLDGESDGDTANNVDEPTVAPTPVLDTARFQPPDPTPSPWPTPTPNVSLPGTACGPSGFAQTSPLVIANVLADDPDGGLVGHSEPGIDAPIIDVFGHRDVVWFDGSCQLLGTTKWITVRRPGVAPGIDGAWVHAGFVAQTTPSCLPGVAEVKGTDAPITGPIPGWSTKALLSSTPEWVPFVAQGSTQWVEVPYVAATPSQCTPADLWPESTAEGSVCVTGITAPDTLNLRFGPGTDFAIRTVLPPNQCGFAILAPPISGWVPLVVDNGAFAGWAASAYLTYGKPSPAPGPTLPLCVNDIESPDTLTVRAGPDVGYSALYKLDALSCQFRQAGAELLGWTPVVVSTPSGEVAGWVSARYIRVNEPVE